jgi:DNA-binding transcriptional ArsR family regulator
VTSSRLDLIFAALANPTRRASLSRLVSGESTVTELAEPFAMSQPAISKHFKVLERAGLVARGRDAQRRPIRLEGGTLEEAGAFLERYRRFLGRELSGARRSPWRRSGNRGVCGAPSANERHVHRALGLAECA